MNQKYGDLIKKLREIFQIDKPDLDFGIYRIINQRAEQIDHYLSHTLREKVETEIGKRRDAEIESQRTELISHLRDEFGKRAFDDDGNLIVEEAIQSDYGKALAKLDAGKASSTEHENAVFSHLLTFFSRYYDKADFISQRRYKGDTYAIPYSGEEVVLHWANKDQYYIKSGENFSNYTFKLDDGRKVHFRLVAADTAKDNRKDNDKDRRFALVEAKTIVRADEDGEEYEETITPIEELEIQENGQSTTELVLRFEYIPVDKSTKQEALISQALERVFADTTVNAKWLDLTRRMPTEKNPQRTVLEKHLNDYTAKNTSDYFIHKDLGGFLRNKLDFYIKNEVMHLDDVQEAKTFADIERNLRMIQCLRAIGQELIRFLAQIENFQKKLWLKKKFVVETNYCITLDRVPEELYPEIAANEAQREEWVKLFAIDEIKAEELGQVDYSEPLTVEFLKSNKHFQVDSKFFDDQFKYHLLSSIQDIDESACGELFHSENFQALNFIQSRHRENVDVTYIDPPYNTDAGPILYKNGYRDSSWITLLDGRLSLTHGLLTSSGMMCATIDDYEHKNLGILLEQHFGELAGTLAIRIKPSGRPIPRGFAVSHEYALFARTNEKTSIQRLERNKTQLARYREQDKKGPFFPEMLRKAGSGSLQSDRPTMCFPIYLNTTSNKLRVPKMTYDKNQEIYVDIESCDTNEIEIWPVRDDNQMGRWYKGLSTIREMEDELKVERQEDGTLYVYYRRRPNEGVQPTTIWFDAEYSATEHGTALLKKLFKGHEVFSYPK